MDKVSQRIEVLQNNNTAQVEFSTLLESMSKRRKEISVPASLHGGIDLKILATLKFSTIRYLLFSSGEITGFSNIPDGVVRFSCAGNLLENMDLLPDTVEELDLNDNMLTSIDLSRLHKLKILRLSNNSLVKLDGFPESLQELYCDYNQLQQLDLKNTPLLRVLHCRGNAGLVLKNVPDSIVDLQMPETLVMDHHVTPVKTSKEYNDYILKYFQIKSRHDEALKDIRSKNGKRGNDKNNKKKISTKNRKPKCAGCQQPCGMLFSSKDEKYTAMCGNTTPCGWKIVIHRGFHTEQDELLKIMKDDLEQVKQDIIQQKLDVLFEYVPSAMAAGLFEDQKKVYTSTSEQYIDLLGAYESKYFNEIRQREIQAQELRIQEKILDVKDALANHDVEQAVRIQHEEIAPVANAVFRQKHEVNTVVAKSFKRGTMVEQDVVAEQGGTVFYLSQEHVHHSKREENLGENPSVEVFGKKSRKT
jgi:hypothetical protein